MKKLIIVALMLVGFSIQAQDVKLMKWYQTYPDSGDTAQVFEYEYNTNDELEIVRHIRPGDWAVVELNYENDTIKYEWNDDFPDDPLYYSYTQDSIYPFYIWDGDTVPISYRYYLEESEAGDDERYVYKYSDGSEDYYFDWLHYDKNCIKFYRGSSIDITYNYDYDYLNPLYNQYKNFKLGHNMLLLWGADPSYNYVKEAINEVAGKTYTFNVIESYNNYPVKVEVVANNSVYWEFYFEYDLTADISEIPSESYTVLSVHYYDLMGRELPKPSKGFYIQSKVTDKGIISTKHYIP